MRKYSVHLCRTGFRHKTVEVEAATIAEAQRKAVEDDDGDYPGECDARVLVEGCVRLRSKLAIEGRKR